MRCYESEAAALRGLKPSSKVLALVLAARMNDTHDNWPGRPVCFPSLDTLAEDTDLGKRAVRYIIAELVEAKVIRVYKDREPGARWDHNIYEWTAPISPNYHPDWMKRPDKQKSAIGARLTNEGWEYCEKNHVGPHAAAADHPEFVLPAEQPVLVDDPGTIATADTSATETLAEEREAGALPIDITPPKKPARPAIKKPADGFDDWWKQYPKKVGKIDARKAYGSAIKQGATPQDLLDGLQRHNTNWKTKNTERQYIPYPASWLRDGRWEDELDTPDSNQTAPAVNPATGQAATKQDFYEACVKHGIDYNGIINFWNPSMALPGSPGWPEVQACLYRQVGRA